MRYSPLVRAWTFHASEGAPAAIAGQRLQRNETTPIVVGNTLYATTPYNRVVALEAASGRLVWKFDLKSGQPATRGVSYWPGGAGTPARILFGTTDGRLLALNAKTGEPIPGFGDEGVVNLRRREDGTLAPGGLSASSPPTIVGDLVLQGAQGGGPGGLDDIRAWDIRTGKLVWRFHTVPRPGEPNYESWQGDPRAFNGASTWGLSTYDSENKLVFVPLKQPGGGYFGAARKGPNLYGTSLVALDAESGRLRWYFQFVHHDIWDYDAGAAPTLLDVVKDGKKIQAVAEITKLGFLWVLDRHTGKPIFGSEERPVPKSDVPGEDTSPTQPFPLKPPPLARIRFKRDEIAKLTPEHQYFCEALFDAEGGMHNDGPFTPYGLKPSVVFPGTLGGGNWGGVSVDPKLNYIFVNTMDVAGVGRMVPSQGGTSYIRQGGMGRFWDGEKTWPCQAPPWGNLYAINANTGDIAWQQPLGIIEGVEAKGALNLGGSIATAGGLVFIGATMDSRFRAFDSKTGRELWVAKLESSARATPITYQGRDGKQYVVITAGSGEIDPSTSDSIIAFALPSK